MAAILKKKKQYKELKGIPSINMVHYNMTEYPISSLSIKNDWKILFYVQKH